MFFFCWALFLKILHTADELDLMGENQTKKQVVCLFVQENELFVLHFRKVKSRPGIPLLQGLTCMLLANGVLNPVLPRARNDLCPS